MIFFFIKMEEKRPDKNAGYKKYPAVYTGAHKKVIDKLRLRHLSDGVGKRDNGYSVKAEYPLFFCPCVEAIDLFTFFEYN